MPCPYHLQNPSRLTVAPVYLETLNMYEAEESCNAFDRHDHARYRMLFPALHFSLAKRQQHLQANGKRSFPFNNG